MLTPQDRNADFRTPIRRLAATVTFASGTRCEVTLFCQPGEDIGQLLTAPEPFLPIDQGGRVRLVARRTLAVVTVSSDQDFDEERTLTRHVTLALRMTCGAEVEGEVAFTPRPGRPRVLDFLNEADATLRLVGSQAVHYVVKEHIDVAEER